VNDVGAPEPLKDRFTCVLGRAVVVVVRYAKELMKIALLREPLS
jgi:hypothetical protein